MTKKINTAIVGMGRAGGFHLTSMKILDYFNLAYVVDFSQEVLGALSLPEGTVATCNFEDVLNDSEVDAVIVSSPTQFHHDHIFSSLSAGKHVFTEKPVGKNLDDILSCFDKAEENGLALHLGFQRRFDPNFRALKSKLSVVSQPRLIRASSRDNPKPSYAYLETSGNIFHDMLIHDFDMMLYLLDGRLPKTIHALAHSYDTKIGDMDDYDTVLVTMQFDDGLIYSIDTSRTSVYGYDQRVELFGSEGMLVAENELDNTLKIFKGDGIMNAPASYSFPQRYKTAYLEELAYFGEGILNGYLHNVSKSHCVASHLIANAGYASAKEKRIINFKEEFGNKLL